MWRQIIVLLLVIVLLVGLVVGVGRGRRPAGKIAPRIIGEEVKGN